MKRLSLKPVCAAIGLALAAPAFAAGLDFSGSNIYMKFLDGNRRSVDTNAPDGSGDRRTRCADRRPRADERSDHAVIVRSTCCS